MTERRILVVDDNRPLAENIAEILEDGGFLTDVFDDPRAALRAVTPGRYDLALIDIRMPGMNGVELYRALKAIDPAVPAIAMTAYSDDVFMRAAVAEGVLTVLPKPVDAALLLSRLRTAVHDRRAVIVEDDAALAQNLREILLEHGFAVWWAPTCAEARRVAPEARPNVALVDWRLPDGDGIDLVGELVRAEDECIAVVFTGYAADTESPRERAAAQGATFMEKPLDIEALLRFVRRA